METLRYYERRGILEDPRRQRRGVREYPPAVVDVVRFIQTAQGLGFTLGEIEELLVLRHDTTRSCREVRAAAQAKSRAIEAKLRRLQGMKRALDQLVNTCTSDGSTRECPILEAIDEEGKRSQHATRDGPAE